MKRRDDIATYLLISVAISILLHAGFWVVARNWHLKAFYALVDDLSERRKITVSAIDLREILKRQEKPKPLKDRILDEQAKRLQELFRERNLITPREVDVRVRADVKRPGEEILKPKTFSPPKLLAPATSLPPKILAIDAADLSPERRLAPRRRIPDVERYFLSGKTVPSLVSRNPGGATGFLTRDIPVGMRMSFKPGGVTPVAPPRSGLGVPTIEPDRKGVLDEGDRIGILDRFLTVEVFVYRTPDGGGYFQVDIRPKSDAQNLKSIPKDVLFLLDASASITQKKLRQFRSGLQDALGALQPDDRFNVVRFRRKPQPLFDRFAPASKDNLAKAESFVKGLYSRGSTDVYGGLAPYVNVSLDEERPYIIFLISDGQTTTGHKLENSEFLRRISQDNRAHASIFSFSCGEDTNLFLMDFISYKNRGFSAHANDAGGAGERLDSYIRSLSQILVADLSCAIRGAPAEETYPRELPHLYRGHDLNVFGRFEPGTENVTIQILGKDRSGTMQELLVNQDLDDATPAGQDLATRWAGQKLVHLVAKQALKPDQAVAAQIQRLSREFNIVVPY